MRKLLLILLALGCGGLGSASYLAALQFRVDPPEIREAEIMDVVVGVLLAVAAVALIHLVRLPRADGARRKLSIVAGLVVLILATGSLVGWHHYTLTLRERAAGVR